MESWLKINFLLSNIVFSRLSNIKISGVTTIMCWIVVVCWEGGEEREDGRNRSGRGYEDWEMAKLYSFNTVQHQILFKAQINKFTTSSSTQPQNSSFQHQKPITSGSIRIRMWPSPLLLLPLIPSSGLWFESHCYLHPTLQPWENIWKYFPHFFFCGLKKLLYLLFSFKHNELVQSSHHCLHNILPHKIIIDVTPETLS